MLRNISINIRIIGLMLILILSIVALAAMVSITAEDVKEEGLADAKAVMLEGQKEKIRLGTQTVAVALGKALEGVTGRQQQHDIISSYIKDYRFEDDNSGYYFTYIKTVIFMHPTLPKREGEDLGNTADKNGVYYVKLLYENAQKGGGFVSFTFPKPGPNGNMQDAPKLAYVEYIPGTDIWISTGIYIDNIDLHQTEMEEQMSASLKHRMLIIIGIIGVFLILFIGPFCVILLRSVGRPLKETVRAAKELSAGNLDISLHSEGRDEIAQLQKAFMDMAASLKSSFMTVRTKEAEASAKAQETQKVTDTVLDVAARVETAAREMEERVSSISRSSAGVKTGGNGQAEILKGILASMERLNSGVLSIAKSAEAAAGQSQVSNEKVEAGVTMVRTSGEAIQNMQGLATNLTQNINKLGDRSRAIGDIMQVISDIAAQINLLAMNASIEAAHAGEAGRGFAVVAAEVRGLAEKTKTAAQEVDASIKDMQKLTQLNISSMDTTVSSIVQVAEISGKTVDSLIEAQNTVKDAMIQVQSIAQAVVEQSASSKEVTSLVHDVNDIAGDNETLIVKVDEELHALLGKSTELLELVSRLQGKRVVEYAWTQDFATGNDYIDDQHKQLFTAVNSLLAAITREESAEALKNAINLLEEYTVRHFSDEEKLLEEYKYPDLPNHRKIHEEFKKTVSGLKQNLNAFGDSAALIKRVRSMTGDWLTFHIKGMDLLWGAYIKERTKASA
ncbi:MAG: bacteriohemerythrin [Spirochaetales bacterium]|jgi:methyl-accepting chemotaxis protein|nr:bacteriohemerythrin [Spirochaetales bacterium]